MMRFLTFSGITSPAIITLPESFGICFGRSAARGEYLRSPSLRQASMQSRSFWRERTCSVTLLRVVGFLSSENIALDSNVALGSEPVTTSLLALVRNFFLSMFCCPLSVYIPRRLASRQDQFKLTYSSLFLQSPLDQLGPYLL